MKVLFKYFAVILIFALMDGFDFYWPHNNGFFSLTFKDGVIEKIDAWHTLKILALFMYAWSLNPVPKIKTKSRFIFYVYFAVIAYIGQLLIYNLLIKSF